MLALLLWLSMGTPQRVGPSFTATGQFLRPLGRHITLDSRPVDLVMSADGQYALVKQNHGLSVIRTSDWTLANEVKISGGASLHGLLCTPDGQIIYSDSQSGVHFGALSAEGSITWRKTLKLPAPSVRGEAYPCGLAMSPTGDILVCSSRSNALSIIRRDVVIQEIPVAPCPYDVALTASGKEAIITCWGRTPKSTSRKEPSSGTDVEVDERGIATGGSICVVDLDSAKVVAKIDAECQPCNIVVRGEIAYIPNANADTLSVLDTGKRRILRDVLVKPDPNLPFGSAPNSACLSEDGQNLFVACGGNNAVAFLSLARPDHPKIEGFIPTNWYPGAVASRAGKLYIASIKGTGSRTPAEGGKFNTHRHSGTVTECDVPDSSALAAATTTVLALSEAPLILRSLERRSVSVRPVPVPARLGDPSVFEHVVYIVKENRTYDQVLGDIGRGESDPKLTIYGRNVTPNHHALANQFVLLDNYYCNGILSADGHAWAMEGNATNYLERAFGGWTRSYPSGDDPISVSTSGFIWDHVLAAGLSFRNFGEFDNPDTIPSRMSFKSVYDAWKQGKPPAFRQSIGVAKLRKYSSFDYPGWNLAVTDQIRADIFLRQLAGFEQKSSMPNLTIVYLPQDHTSGLAADAPTPRAMVADNDLALGRVVEGLTRSRFWPKTCIFVIEDDPQDGFDHVDGHRSVCLAISPYSRRGGKVVSDFYNQTSVVHTILQILGVAPMSQMDARSPLMTRCFTTQPDLRPYKALPAAIPLDEMNLSRFTNRTRAWSYWARRSKELDLRIPDTGKDDLLNKILWYAARPKQPYPAKFAGAHGRGLRSRKLLLDRSILRD